MHLTFTPELCNTTTLPLPKLADGATDYVLTFKASFDSPAAYEEAQRDGARVEMWTDLPALGSEETGGWRALAFEYAGKQARTDAKEDDLVFSCVVSGRIPSPVQDETAVYATVRVPATLITEGSMFSFTYRVLYPSGHVQWLGAYGQNGILEFAKRDVRVNFDVNGNEIRLSGEKEKQVGNLNSDLAWGRWAVDNNGVNFAATAAASPSRSIVLIPRSTFGIHSIIPLEPFTLSAEGSSGVSITSEGDILYHPNAFSGTTSESGIVKHITNSRAILILSSNGGYPATLTAIPAQTSPVHSSHSTVRIPINELLDILPSSQEFVLFHKGNSNFLEISHSLTDDVIALQVPSSGGQVSVTPLFNIPAENERDTSVSVGLSTPHSGVEVVPAIHASALLPTPPPSPPAENTTLPGINTTIETVEVSTALEVVEEVDEPEMEVQFVPDNLDEEDEGDVPQPINSTSSTPGGYAARTSSALITRPRSPPLTVEHILKLGMDFIVRTLIARFFGVLWVILAWFGLKFPQRPSVANEEKENADEESVDEEHIEKQPSFANEPAAEEQPQLDTTVVTLIDTIEEVPEETTEDLSEEPDTKPRPSPLASRRACFAADALSQAVALLIRSPFVDGKPAIPQFSITFDGQSIDNFKMGPLSTPAKSETALHLVVFDGTVLGGKVELMLN